ncbi:MAG: zf-HC2 domain-containing protein [Acidobacteria bacterium]|nr:zf-HC2 domain-containing protein [Acidobacteriota bacterium]MCW5969071.1 zf-HC2 domain-containing protein [Blastocatellales bacterium]
MNQVSCESICLAAMAVADGETPPIPAPEIEIHLAQCAHCRSEVGQLKSVIELLNAQRRSEQTENVWDGVAKTLRRRSEAQRTSDHWPWFLLLGLLLAGYRIGVAATDWEPGLWFKLAPILVAVAVFALLRENPFKVNSGIQFQTSLRGH